MWDVTHPHLPTSGRYEAPGHGGTKSLSCSTAEREFSLAKPLKNSNIATIQN
jgi:hypothetical protein